MTTVKTEQGFVRGIHCKYNDVTYYSYKGIPYAKPPLGELRFKAPESPEPWMGIRNATQHGPVCPQYNERLDQIESGSENCLYLNVYSKDVIASTPLPVMVWIHGGGFYTGSGNSDFYGPDFFMEHNLVLVTFNYRLEVLGFLCLDIDEVPGNAGLKDQVAALKWVKKNIHAFGGDPNNITLFGCSAGSASASYHMLSKMSDGLFNKVICQSGVSMNEWSYDIYARERSLQLGKLLGANTENPKELLQFLRGVPVESLVNIKLPPLQIENFDTLDLIAFKPVIENKELNVEKFISESPIDLVKNGQIAKVPIILGYTSGEGIEIARHLSNLIDYYNTVGSVVPREIKLKINKEILQAIDAKIRKYYFKNKSVSNDMSQDVSNLEMYRVFVTNIVRFARYHEYHTSKAVYLYKFNVESERNIAKKKYQIKSLEGTCHADDLPYFFNVTNPEVPLTEDSKILIKNIVKLWFNFASKSNPTPSQESIQWKPFTNKSRHCFIIDREFQLKNVDEKNVQFWEEIYKVIDNN